MNRAARSIPPRVEMLLLRAGLIASTALSVLLGACTESAQQEQMALGDGQRVYIGGGAAGGSEAVFEVPEAAVITSVYGASSFPEYARLDGRMNIAGSGPIMATADWPQPAAPDATNVYVTYLPLTTSSSYQAVPVYQPQGTYNPRYHRRWWY